VPPSTEQRDADYGSVTASDESADMAWWLAGIEGSRVAVRVRDREQADGDAGDGVVRSVWENKSRALVPSPSPCRGRGDREGPRSSGLLLL